jgi:signal transduction histidine kinase
MSSAAPGPDDEPLVLVVDDEAATRQAVRRALSDEAAVLAVDGAEPALNALQTQPVWVLISDQRMPGTTGCELLSQVVERHPDVVRIMLTGYADVDTVRQAINGGGVYHCLTKPWDTRELRQVVRRGIERYRAARERERLMRSLETACADLQREVERRARLLALTTHELGTPVHILVNALDLATVLDTATAAEWLRTARRASLWLTRVLGQVATTARLDTMALPLHRAPVALDALVHVLCERLRLCWGERRLSFDLTAPASSVTVVSDRRWLEQAIWNLLTNAVRFTPDGGRVEIAVESDDQHAVVTVCDSGIGIAPEHLADLFEPFPSALGNPLLHTSGFLEFGTRGVGLGLATVQRIMEALGGTVGVESALQKGSRFTLTLPGLASPERRVPHCR